MRIALIGAGWHSAAHHAPALRRVMREYPHLAECVVVCDLDMAKAERLRAACGFQASYASIEAQLAAERLDAIVAILPQRVMLPVTRQLRATGLPLLIEKPLGCDLAEARELAALCRSARVMVSLNRRFDPGLQRARAWIGEQTPLRALQGSMLRVNRDEGDFLYTTGIHLLDAMCYLGGPLALSAGGVVSAGGCARCGRLAGDGVVATFAILPTAGRMEERHRLTGDGWCVDLWTGTSHPWAVEAWRDGELALSAHAGPDEEECVRNGTYAETVAFLTAVAGGTPLPAPAPDDLLPVTELITALEAW